ncbi:MAG: glycosyltransferase family 4 protein [Blastocatellia bacterium]|nr:glycosyltransferase family 4 protein [Blastocatellia bacterium]MCS7157464.1 glycosyltransferase family 4 protein [Blastocatellia bacterium]MCX7752637.1 glycosyltransferase family 4 protein [Blastocatellia bacterium]MDW8168368.1 glycosyltransferase family 4 protein [Acidobacteriota bacterium]MDW8255564.1 glycosyltransferase family 4 protein [Acidobacteriota bacterium]
MRIVILSPDYPPKRSGLADHTRHLAEHLRRLGQNEVIVLTTSVSEGGAAVPTEAQEEDVAGVLVRRVIAHWGWRGFASLAREITRAAPDWLLVPYVPHAYGRGGVNLAFPLMLVRERLRGRRLLLLVHELYADLPLFPLRHLSAALAQRAMFWLAAGAARGLAVSIEPWTTWLRQAPPIRWTRARIFHLPSPSNIEPVPTDRERVRRHLGLREEEVVLAFFGTLHVSKKRMWLLRSVEALSARQIPTRLLAIGPDSEELLALAPMKVREKILAFGYVDAPTVSRLLQASDLFLLPLSDGVSTRRSSLMAALSHGLPVVGTSGRLTDESLKHSGALLLSPADDLDAFLRHVVALAEDAERRRQLGERGRALYRERYDWPVIAERVLAVLRDLSER